MKIYFVSGFLNDAEVVVPGFDITFIPSLGDYIDIKKYLEGVDLERFQEYTNNTNSIVLGTVEGRTLSREGNEDILYISLNFAKKPYRDEVI